MAVDLIGERDDSRALQGRVSRLLGNTAKGTTVVGVAKGGQVGYAGFDRSNSALDWAHAVVQIGCLAKLFTSALVRRAIQQGLFSIETNPSELLGAALGASLRIKDLLEHTHGFDDSTMQGAPLGRGGFIDVSGLEMALSQQPKLHPSTELYSYSNAGSWLLAAILERCFGTRYFEMLNTLLRPYCDACDLTDPCLAAEDVCAASGGRLTLPISVVLGFLAGEMIREDDESLPNVLKLTGGQPLGLSGWNPVERGIRLGWKYHGAGWFGHNSIWPPVHVVVRINPRARTVIVVSTKDLIAARVAGALFNELPKLQEFPKPASVAETAAVDFRPYVGDYRRAAASVSIRLPRQAAFAAHLPVSRAAAASLVPAGDHLFLALPPVPHLPFIQLIRPVGDRFLYLWDGRKVYCRRDP